MLKAIVSAAAVFVFLLLQVIWMYWVSPIVNGTMDALGFWLIALVIITVATTYIFVAAVDRWA